ncbi:MAG: hypothetical protein KTR32_39945 [Granulosicoccus sp.]|nr:hypothetical protein [Granulosicoccus sp.]
MNFQHKNRLDQVEHARHIAEGTVSRAAALLRQIIVASPILLLNQQVFAAPELDGQTIVLPDDGWYQVQRASDYESLCEGELRCPVEPGFYIVINHTSGERFEMFEVPADNHSADSPIRIVGNQISWPDDGWYQVQDASTYESLCEGGLSCTVPDGTYIVINHTDGTRYDEITVSTNTGSATINEANFPNVLRNVVQILNTDLLDNARNNAGDRAIKLTIMGNQVVAGSSPDDGLSLLSQTADTPDLTSQQYVCVNNGTLSLSLYDFGFAPIERRALTFDHCQYGTSDYDGGYEYNSGRRSATVILLSNFSERQNAESGYVIDGRWEDLTAANPQGVEIKQWTDTRYESMSGAKSESISQFNWYREAFENWQNIEGNDGFLLLPDGSLAHIRQITQSARLDSSFKVNADWSQQQDIEVQASLGYDGNFLDWAFSALAQVQIPDFPVSDLGSPLTLYASPDLDPGTAFTIENLPRNAMQWQSGEINILAQDGSGVSMQPSSERTEVNIFLNGSTQAIVDNWSDGLQIDCPITFVDECN